MFFIYSQILIAVGFFIPVYQGYLWVGIFTNLGQNMQNMRTLNSTKSGINQMWILKNFKEILEHLKSPTFIQLTSINSWFFSTLYTTIAHQILKIRLTSISETDSFSKTVPINTKYLVLGHEETYFIEEHSNSKNKYSEDDIIKMREFLVDNFFVFLFWRKSLQADSRHSNGYKLCLSPRRYLSVFIRSGGIHKVFVLNWNETVSISVKFHLHVQRWCIVHR